MPGDDDHDARGGADEPSTDGDEDHRVLVDREPESETYRANERSVEGDGGWSVDPIGVGIALVIVLVAAGLLIVGPLSGSAGTPASPPDADFTAARINDSYVQVGHVGGDDVAGDRLSLVVDGEERSPGWPDTVSKGEVIMVRADANSTMTLYWTGEDERTELDNWTV